MTANLFDSVDEASCFNVVHINFHYIHIDTSFKVYLLVGIMKFLKFYVNICSTIF